MVLLGSFLLLALESLDAVFTQEPVTGCPSSGSRETGGVLYSI